MIAGDDRGVTSAWCGSSKDGIWAGTIPSHWKHSAAHPSVAVCSRRKEVVAGLC